MTKLEKKIDITHKFSQKKTRRNARQQGEHMTRTVHLPTGMMFQLSYNTVQLQA